MDLFADAFVALSRRILWAAQRDLPYTAPSLHSLGPQTCAFKKEGPLELKKTVARVWTLLSIKTNSTLFEIRSDTAMHGSEGHSTCLLKLHFGNNTLISGILLLVRVHQIAKY